MLTHWKAMCGRAVPPAEGWDADENHMSPPVTAHSCIMYLLSPGRGAVTCQRPCDRSVLPATKCWQASVFSRIDGARANGSAPVCNSSAPRGASPRADCFPAVHFQISMPLQLGKEEQESSLARDSCKDIWIVSTHG